MRTLRLIALCSALLALAGLVTAQAKEGDQEKDKEKPAKEKPEKEKKPAEVKVGDKMPALKVSAIVHPKFKSMKEAKGKLVLYEYFQHW